MLTSTIKTGENKRPGNKRLSDGGPLELSDDGPLDDGGLLELSDGSPLELSDS